MDNKQAQHQIREIFQHPFQRANYLHFLRNLLNQIEPRDAHYTGNLIPGSFKEHVTQYWRIGKYIDPDGIEMDLLVVEVKSLSKLDRARSALRNFAVNRLKQFGKDCSLVAFYAKDDGGDDWRFSYVKIEHEAHQDDRGKIRLKTELTPAKRYSYLVGVHENSHTACQQLMPLLVMDYANPRIEEIEKAFSIEKVTDEFFEQYKGLYLKLSEQLKSQPFFKKETEEENAQTVARFAKKLLGQIVFLYFLQKKGWLGVAEDGKWGDGSRRFMRDRFTQIATNEDNYYHDFLQYLFYEALAKERKNQADPDYYERFSCKIPFLNGGLFEAEYDDWHNLDIDLPNSLFHNDEKNKSGDVGTGILDVFDRYNFTIKEDEPLEKEVAVDPEMLGKVFENMLEITERKSKGAFYTPREIVHYMCQESLINYLDNGLNSYAKLYQAIDSNQPILFGGLTDKKGQQKLEITHQDGIKVPKEDLETLIRKGHLFVENDEAALQALQRIESGEQKTTKHKIELPESIKSNAGKIDNYLASIRACDPAIGSGAFPVGLLHEIVNARLALAPHSGNSLSVYELKRHTIHESLYGVDIDASAVDIARLRLWLSLIVDEDDFNFDKALPNLDYKIVCGNSLIGFPEDWKSQASDKIEELKKEFFDEKDQEEKAKKKQQIDAEIQARMANSKQNFGYQVGFDFKLYFSEVWHEKNGFDVVIGNPPFVQIQKFSGQQIQKDLEKQKYDTFAKTGDIYCLFYEKGRRILRDGGALCFISSNKWMLANYGQKLRQLLIQKTNPIILINFSSFPVFETATVDTNILIFEKATNKAELKACVVNSEFNKHTNIEHFFQENHIRMDDLSDESWVITDKTEGTIKKRIEASGVPLKDWGISINYGIKTSFNEAFIIDGKTKNDLIVKDPRNAEIIKPILRGRDIKRYKVEFDDWWLINTHNGYSKVLAINIDDYPAIKQHLVDIEEKRVRGELGEKAQKAKGLFCRDDQGKTPYNLRNCAYIPDFEKKKIVWGNLALSCQFALAESGVYISAPSPIISGGDRFLLAVLNSKVADYYIRSLGVTRNGGYFEYKPMFVEKMPIPQLVTGKQAPYILLADYMLLSTITDLKLQSAYFEDLIDGLVFELYFTDEIKAAGKDILKHLGDLKPINDDMSDEEKLAVIQREFDRLYDPKHPVRNNLETLDSVEEVRIIREALKK
jgi:hypothetical protein